MLLINLLLAFAVTLLSRCFSIALFSTLLRPWAVTHTQTLTRPHTHTFKLKHTHTHVPNLYTYIDKLRRLPFRFFLLCFTCLAVLCLMDLCFDVQTVYTILGSTTAQPYMWMCVCWSVYIRDHHLQSWAFFPSAMWRP